MKIPEVLSLVLTLIIRVRIKDGVALSFLRCTAHSTATVPLRRLEKKQQEAAVKTVNVSTTDSLSISLSVSHYASRQETGGMELAGTARDNELSTCQSKGSSRECVQHWEV